MFADPVSTQPVISIHAPLTGSDYQRQRRPQKTNKFQSTLPLRGATLILSPVLWLIRIFQSTLPLRGATPASQQQRIFNPISIHAPLTGSDFSGGCCPATKTISIHAPLTGSDRWASSSWAAVSISIHAPLTGSDCLSDRFGRPPNNSIHAPLYGERPQTWAGTPQLCNFNPRSPYGERPGLNASRYQKCDFNPRSPYGERLRLEDLKNESNTISIHAPYGSDLFYSLGIPSGFHFNPRSPYGERLATAASRDAAVPFQSTLPLRGATAEDAVPPEPTTIFIHAPLTGATRNSRVMAAGSWISIHAPLTGSDYLSYVSRPASAHFNPRSPYGERRPLLWAPGPGIPFQSTLPYGERQVIRLAVSEADKFQSTLPLTGSDCNGACREISTFYFNPRSPYGERLLHIADLLRPIISIHAPLTGSDMADSINQADQFISIHAPLTGSDSDVRRFCLTATHFNPRSPYGERRLMRLLIHP